MLELAKLFQDNMVLQREKGIKVWGKADAGAKVICRIQGKTAETQTTEDGSFIASMPLLDTSEEETLEVSCGTEQIICSHVAVGEVWIAGGQSNMEFWMHYEMHLEEIKADCCNSRIRYFETPKVAFDGQEKCFDFSEQGIWRTADAKNIDYFSGTGYFFARYLEEKLNCPVGIVSCCMGSTTTPAWMSRESAERVGQAWIRDFEARTSSVDMDAFWEKQKTYSGNNLGHPFENEYNNTFLPKVRTTEEACAYMQKAMADGSIDLEYMGLTPMSVPASLYEHMLKRIAPFTARGVIWYQGESDEPHANIYAIMLTRMIGDWRTLWDDKLPFLEVQLPAYDSWMNYPQTRWNEIRMAQQAVADTVDQVWMTSVSDSGEQYDIHPKDKKKPGERLAMLALGKVYGQNFLCEPPYPQVAVRQDNTITVHFAHAEGGLTVLPEGAADEQEAKIYSLHVETELPYKVQTDGSDICFTFDKIPQNPVTIRLGMDQFYRINLFNRSGIPAASFEIRA